MATRKRKAAEAPPESVLVTGGAGFIASHVVSRLAQSRPDRPIVVLDKLDYVSSIENLTTARATGIVHFVKGDIRSPDLVGHLLESFNVRMIIHAAAQTHVDNSFGNSLQFTDNNVRGTHVLLECAKQYGKIERFIHVSTDEVYGEVQDGESAARERFTLLTPTNPYAATKAAAEYLVLAYHRSFDLPIIITRGNNVYGPHQFPEKIIPKFSIQIARGRKITIHGDGSHRRSFLHVSDVARALELVATKGKIGEIYNIGTDFEVSNLDVATEILGILKPGKKVADFLDFCDDRPFNDCRYAIDSSKLHELGWTPQKDWKEGLKETVDWYVSGPGSSGTYWPTDTVDQCLVAHPRMGLGAE